MVARHRRGQCSALPPRQPVQRYQRRVRAAFPGWGNVGARGQQHQHPLAGDPRDEPVEQLQRGRVGPVQVFEDAQYRLPAGEAGHALDQCLDRGLALLLRWPGERRVAPLQGDRQDRRDQWRRIACPVRLLLPAGPQVCPAWRPADRPVGSRQPAPGARSAGGATCRHNRASTGAASGAAARHRAARRGRA